jgi:hypothetical protein
MAAAAAEATTATAVAADVKVPLPAGSGRCAVCKAVTTMQCGKCHTTFYCSAAHIKSDWTRHKTQCTSARKCAVCNAPAAILCSKYCDVYYCSTLHQEEHKPHHKARCPGMIPSLDELFKEGMDQAALKSMWDAFEAMSTSPPQVPGAAAPAAPPPPSARPPPVPAAAAAGAGSDDATVLRAKSHLRFGMDRIKTLYEQALTMPKSQLDAATPVEGLRLIVRRGWAVRVLYPLYVNMRQLKERERDMMTRLSDTGKKETVAVATFAVFALDGYLKHAKLAVVPQAIVERCTLLHVDPKSLVVIQSLPTTKRVYTQTTIPHTYATYDKDNGIVPVASVTDGLF